MDKNQNKKPNETKQSSCDSNSPKDTEREKEKMNRYEAPSNEDTEGGFSRLPQNKEEDELETGERENPQYYRPRVVDPGQKKQDKRFSRENQDWQKRKAG